MEGLGIVLFGTPYEMKLEFGDDGVVELDELEVDLDALASVGITESFGDSLSVGLVGDPTRGSRRLYWW